MVSKGITMNGHQTSKLQHAWHTLTEQYALQEKQVKQLQRYLELLIEWNEQINLTAITIPDQIVTHHFKDSLQLAKVVDLEQLHMICDVGTGAGFPGIPLKIKYPHLKVILIEVTGKKISFLRTVIQELGLEDIELFTLDWRTFLRKTSDPIDIFVSRASLAPEELIRMFKPSSPYKDKQLVYWASEQWQPNSIELPFIKTEQTYQLNSKKRRLIIFSNSNSL